MHQVICEARRLPQCSISLQHEDLKSKSNRQPEYLQLIWALGELLRLCCWESSCFQGLAEHRQLQIDFLPMIHFDISEFDCNQCYLHRLYQCQYWCLCQYLYQYLCQCQCSCWYQYWHHFLPSISLRQSLNIERSHSVLYKFSDQSHLQM